MKLNTVLTFMYLCTSALVFVFFRAEVMVWLSFFINFCFITAVAYFHLNFEKTYSPFLTSFIVFFYLFCIVAPVIQLSAYNSIDSPYPTNYPYKFWDIIYANVLIFIFCVCFFIGYLYFKKSIVGSNNQNKLYRPIQVEYSAPLVIIILLVISLLVVGFNFNYVLNDITQSIYIKTQESVSSLIIKKKVLFFIPLGGLVYTYFYLKKKRKINTNTVVALFSLFILLFILFFLKNPLTEKRNALGPIYITLIFIFYPKLINTNAKFFLFMFFSLVILFPLMSTFTHIDASFSEIIDNPYLIVESYIRFGGISTAYSSLHYDSYANIMATVDYVGKEGMSFGFQLIGALLFFIPRSLWASKPLSTGELIGNHLIDDFGFTYNNLSNSMVSEGYINFGFLGVIFFALLLSYFVVFFLKWLRSSNCLKEAIAFYFAIHLIFILRGDLTNAYTYFIGPFIAMYLIPDFFRRLFIKKRK